MKRKPYFGMDPSFLAGTPIIMDAGAPNYLESVNNRIYFYSDIDSEKVLKLNKSLREMSGQMILNQFNLSLEEVPPIYLHINSYGGFVFDGLSASDEIVKLNETVPVYTVVDGIVASAATFMSVVGAHRQIKKNSFMLVHQLSSAFWGKYSEITDEKQNLDLLMETIRNIYKEYTKVPKKQLDEILKHDVYWDSETCLQYGLVDEII